MSYLNINKFVIEPEEAEAMSKSAGVATIEDLLPLLVPTALRLARVPISNFPVGSVGLGASGRIYLGINMEFTGLPLNNSIHSEQFLIMNAAQHGETKIRRIAVSAVPCGHCRQFLQEIRGASEIQIVVTSGTGAGFRPLSSLLPNPFGPADLLDDDAPLLLEPHYNEIGDLDPSPPATETPLEEKLRSAATSATRASHAPYSGCAAGFAIVSGDGNVYAGSYVESAAFNPSFGLVQSAIVAMVTAGGEDNGIVIKSAVLVERSSAMVSHESSARVLLASVVSPDIEMKVYRF